LPAHHGAVAGRPRRHRPCSAAMFCRHCSAQRSLIIKGWSRGHRLQTHIFVGLLFRSRSLKP
jgi:hypothetical protein